MSRYERCDSCDSFENFHLETSHYNERDRLNQHGRIDTESCDNFLNNGPRSDDDSAMNSYLIHGCRMHADDEWLNHQDETDYYNSDEGARVEPSQNDHQSVGNIIHGFYNHAELATFFRSLLGPDPAPGREGLSNNAFNIGTTATSGIDTPASPSSMYPEPGSSGSSGNNSSDSSMENSILFPDPRDTTESVIVYMTQSNDPVWQSTPANYFTSSPLWLAPHFVSGLSRVLEEEDEEHQYVGI